MKSFVVAASAMLMLAACSQTSYPTSDPNPPQGRTYPGNNNYPREGQIDGVVRIIRVADYYDDYRLPPGQAKKRYGGRSARVYAHQRGYGNRVATVIAVPDFYSSRSNSGQRYYNYRGYTYWKQNDGYYYISNYRR